MKHFSKFLVVRPDSNSGFNSEHETEHTAHSNPTKSPGPLSPELTTLKKRGYSPRPTEEPKFKYRHVWRRAALRAKLRKMLGSMNNEILLYGTSNEVVDASTYEEIVEIKRKKALTVLSIQQKLPWYVLSPVGNFCSIWGLVVLCMMAYTVTYMPFRIAFQDPVYFDSATFLDLIVDLMFILDASLNFFISYKVEGDFYEASLTKIFINYLKSWFLLDIISCFPVTLVEAFTGDPTSTRNTSSITKAARLPRLYKILRVIRISKLTNVYKRHPIYIKLSDFLDVHSVLFKFIKFFIMAVVCVHNLACLWYLAAKFEEFSYETWVVRLGFYNNSISSRYLTSFYWATTTLSTVGYGDISAGTNIEMIISIITMGAGVAFYSMIISSVTSLISHIDIKESKTEAKLSQADDFGVEVGLSKATRNKIRKLIRYNADNSAFDKRSLFSIMPKALKYEVAMSMYNGIAKVMPILTGKDESFVVSLFSRLRSCTMTNEDELLYSAGSIADEVYFVVKGRMQLVLPECEEVVFKSYLKAAYYGEIELFHNIVRLDSVKTCFNTQLLILGVEGFHQLLAEFPEFIDEFQQTALERLRRNTKEKIKAYEELVRISPEMKVDVSVFRKAVTNFEYLIRKHRASELSEALDRDRANCQKADELQAETEELKELVMGLLDRVKHNSPAKVPLPSILKTYR
jgi:hypothetical protein